MVSGVRGTGNILAARIMPDVDNKTFLLDANKAPLVALLAKLRKKATVNPKFSWFTDEFAPRWDAINDGTGYSDSDTSMTVDNASYFKVGYIVKNTRTGEQMIVTAVGSTTVAFTRGYGETSAAAINDDDDLLIIGNANEEGATSPTVLTTQQVEQYNYCQIVRTPVELTETEINTEMWNEQDLPYQRRKAGIEHSQDIERLLWFGERKLDTSGTHPKRTMRGVFKWLSTNVTDAGGTLTEAEFESFLRAGFRYGSRKKYLFASALVVSAISSWAQSKLQMLPTDKTYGIAINRYISPHGEVLIVKHDLFEGTGATAQEYGGYAALIDLEDLKYRHLQNRDTRLKMNVQANDSDSQKDEYLTECGLQLGDERKHSVLNDVITY